MTHLWTGRLPRILVGLLLAVSVSFGGVQAEWMPDESVKEQRKAAKAIKKFRNKKPKLERYFDEAYGYAILWSVTRAGLGFGGAGGRGVLIEQDEMTGKTGFWQFTSGIQAGVQVFSMIVFFKDEEAVDYFKQRKLEFIGQASISLANLGARTSPAYNDGVAVFTRTRFGLMGELAVSLGQFTYKPLKMEAIPLETGSVSD
jgi:lipid-binding SYLF domain-containing protein